jgi:hypothetical protein
MIANMNKYLSFPKVRADLHAGNFFWERYVVSLEIFNDGSVTYEILPTSSGNGPRVLTASEPNQVIAVRFTGNVVARSRPGWMEIHLFQAGSEKKLRMDAVEVDGELICSIYSEFNSSLTSELLVRQGI